MNYRHFNPTAYTWADDEVTCGTCHHFRPSKETADIGICSARWRRHAALLANFRRSCKQWVAK